MKRVIFRIVGVLVVLLAGFGYKIYTGESSGADVMQKIMDNFYNEDSITYVEEYSGDESEGVYTYSRDAEGNILISDVGTDIAESYDYDMSDYKIGDVYYTRIEGVNYEYGSDEINQFEGYEGYDIEGYFKAQEDYVLEMLKNNGSELFDNEIDAEFKREGDFYVATGVDSEGTEYRIALAKDGSTLSLEEEGLSFKVTFDTETIKLP